MAKATTKLTSAVFTTCLFVAGAQAAPISLSEAQMDSVAAGGVETTDGFICPVITTDAVLNSVKGAGPIGEGDYTILGPNVTVPVHATNGNGAGSPGGPYSNPGDTDYTAIWAL